jgi:hypothetical protein
MFGERKLDVAGGQPVTTTAGVVKFLQGTDNVTTKSLATIVEKDVLDWCEELFKYGSDQRLFLCSPSWLSLFSTWAEGKLQVEQGETTFGLSIMRYHTPHGDLLLTRHPLFVEGYSGYGIALDMAQLKYGPLEGRDTKFQTNIQNNDEDGERDQYITETGLELRQPKMHGMFILS